MGLDEDRSIKTTAKAYALDLAIRMVDLTTLEGADTHGRVRGLAAKALSPDPSDLTTPRPAAVCVYGDMVGIASEGGDQRPWLRHGGWPADWYPLRHDAEAEKGARLEFRQIITCSDSCPAAPASISAASPCTSSTSPRKAIWRTTAPPCPVPWSISRRRA